MYIRSDELENQNSSNQHHIRTCQMCSTCPHSETCSLISGDSNSPDFDNEFQGEMTRQYHMPHYPHMQYPHHHHYMQYQHPYYHHYYQPFYPPYFSPYYNQDYYLPWILGGLFSGR